VIPNVATFDSIPLNLQLAVKAKMSLTSIFQISVHHLKHYRPRFTRLVKSPITTKQVCAFRRFHLNFSVNLNDVKNEPRQYRNRFKLSAWNLGV